MQLKVKQFLLISAITTLLMRAACLHVFSIDVSTDNLEDDELCKITLSLDTGTLDVGKYQWDLFLWSGDHPIKCLVKGQVNIIEGVSNRGK